VVPGNLIGWQVVVIVDDRLWGCVVVIKYARGFGFEHEIRIEQACLHGTE
jgi:hypothetical protein